MSRERLPTIPIDTLDDFKKHILGEKQYKLYVEARGDRPRQICSLTREIMQEGDIPREVTGSLSQVTKVKKMLEKLHRKEIYTIEEA